MKTHEMTVTEYNATPYMQGYKAYGERKGVVDNPHPAGTKEHEHWYDGWRKADRDDGN